MRSPVSRRKFLGAAATASLAAGLPAASAAAKSAPAPRAAAGSEWPLVDGGDEKALLDVLRSGK
jgi:hypothetical protein